MKATTLGKVIAIAITIVLLGLLIYFYTNPAIRGFLLGTLALVTCFVITIYIAIGVLPDLLKKLKKEVLIALIAVICLVAGTIASILIALYVISLF